MNHTRQTVVLIASVTALSTVACASALAASTPTTTTTTGAAGLTTSTSSTTTTPTTSSTTSQTPTSAGTSPAAASLTIAPGVKIGPISLGGDTKTKALAALNGFLAAPLRFTFEGAYWSAPRARLGASFDPAAALVAKAFAASPHADLALSLTIKRGPLLSYLAELERRFGHPAQHSFIRLVNQRAVVGAGRPGITIDDPKMASAIASALRSGLSERLALIVNKTPTTAAAAATKAVVVNLETQTLTAYLNGKPILKTPITTGRPALPTPVGNYRALYKASPFVFHSPWPPGSPYWYPPTPVHWAIDFYNGDFLHDDPPEPTDAFGRDSEYGPYASHGCVHVPYSVMSFLFGWLPVGAQVVVAE